MSKTNPALSAPDDVCHAAFNTHGDIHGEIRRHMAHHGLTGRRYHRVNYGERCRVFVYPTEVEDGGYLTIDEVVKTRKAIRRRRAELDGDPGDPYGGEMADLQD